MGQPLFLAENFFNTQQFPTHIVETLTGRTEAVGQEAFHVGTARRSVLNGFRNENPALSLIATVTCDRVREADCIVLDRNSDLIGHTFSLQISNNDFTGANDEFAVIDVIPSDVVLGSSLNDPVHAIRTSEGAWIIKFNTNAAIGWRIISSVVSSDSGRFGGVYLGKSFTPSHGGRMPFDDEDTWLDFGSVRRGVPDNDVRHGRTGSFSMMMSGEAEWSEARRQFRELFGKGHPMWIAPDSDMAERTWLGYNAPGSMGAAFSERPQGRTVVITADEYDPRLP